MESNQQARAALAAVTNTRSALADRLVTPWWYHPILGGCVGAVVLLLGGVLGAVGTALLVVPIIGMGALASTYRRLTGVDLLGNPVSHGSRTRGLIVVLVVGYVLAVAGSFILGGQHEISWIPWVLAVLILILTVLVGRAYDAALRAELRSPQS